MVKENDEFQSLITAEAELAAKRRQVMKIAYSPGMLIAINVLTDLIPVQ